MKRDVDLGGLDIQTYLAEHQRKDLLRFLTCGNVDDGKSTLIGRLLHDAKSLYEDQLAAVRADSERFNTTGGDEIDLALLVDGLQAEREQGITIDVAYRYFSTSARKFIIADTPGHEQYTRNMATGASTCDLAIILIDARHGVRPQTKRHSFIASLLGIRSLVVAVNKMDAVGYAQSRFEEIRRDYLDFASKLGLQGVVFLPLSALRGDNVVNASQHMPWYEGPTLLRHLETVPIASGPVLSALRFPVQWVNRPNLDFRGYCGTIASGEVRPGDEVLVLPSGRKNRVKSVLAFEGPREVASAGMAVTLTLENEVDISRGDLLAHPQGAPSLSTEAEAMLVWMSETPLVPGREYFIKHTTKRLKASVQEIAHRVNIHTLEHEAAEQLALNEIAQVRLSFSEPLAFDSYEESRATGAFIVIDRLSNNTVGAGMLLSPTESPRAQQRSEPPAHSPEQSAQPSKSTGPREPYADIARLYELEYAPFTADADFYARRLAPKRASVLELGCGGGRVALALARAGHRVTGLDISEPMLEIGRQRAEAEKLPVRFLAQDIAGFSLEERFDAVILSFSIFAFLPNAEARARCLESCKAHLAEGGRVFVDHFVPDLSTLARGESALRYVKTFRDSEGPAIVNKFEATKYEAATGRLWCEERYEVHPFTGPSERFGGTLPLSVLFPEEMVLLFERHGLITTARFGGYSEEAFTPESARHLFIAEAL